MTAYFVSDIPSEPLAIVPSRDGEPVDLSAYDSATVTLDGTELTATIEAETVDAVWPSTSLFPSSGLYPVTVILETADGSREAFDAEPVVIQESDGWHTLASARREWSSSSNLTDGNLYTLLSAARFACESFAPEIAEDATVPLRYRQAQLMQTRNLLNAAKVSTSGDFDEGSYALPARPLDWHVKALLRPQRGRPLVG